ncbi:MAG: hypothetical protein ACKOUR_03065 [Planctomycetota bacterium]
MAATMHYRYEIVCRGSGREALRIIREALLANEFGIDAVDDRGFVARGPGLRSSRENAIRGVSEARVSMAGDKIELQAELGGVVRLGRFATFFPLALGASLALVFGLILWGVSILGGNGELARRPANLFIPLLAPLLTTLPWLLLGPWLTRVFRRRTERAIESLVQSAAHIASTPD